ncbi:MAG: oxidoreductase, partial [Myxococcales bacterium]|nr:oxidoreductase [Myxococcales bacterium]
CEDELLPLAGAVDIVTFAEATSRRDDGGPLDVVLVEGSVSTAEQLAHLRTMRARAKVLVTIGACATAGGIQALRNGRDVKEFLRVVYARPEYVDTLAEATPVALHVPVDFELRGCPIAKGQLLELLTALLLGRRPQLADESVCLECKRAGNVCVMVASDAPCLGPVTHAGCGALCPTFARGCYGCFGPKENAATPSFTTILRNRGESSAQIARRFRTFTGEAEAFAKVHRALDATTDVDEEES